MIGLFVGVLIALREPARREGSYRSMAMAIPALLGGALVFRSGAPFEWSAPASWLVCSGSLLTIWSLWCLGKSFAVLPAQRTTVTRGPYRLIRHPIYLGELLMLLGCVVTEMRALPTLGFVLTLPLLWIRILEEERLMENCPSYRMYTHHTRFRLLPYVC